MTTKLFTREVRHCLQCPNAGRDCNLTRVECRAKNNAFICWDDSYGEGEDETPYPPIPAWCPLPNKP